MGRCAVTTVAKDERCRSGAQNGASPAVGHDDTPASDREDVVRLGDEHVNSTESLCVGESQ
jgi:hypothetical protein